MEKQAQAVLKPEKAIAAMLDAYDLDLMRQARTGNEQFAAMSEGAHGFFQFCERQLRHAADLEDYVDQLNKAVV